MGVSFGKALVRFISSLTSNVFEDRIRTFPLVGVGVWTLEKLDFLWFIAQHHLSQLWKIFVFQSDWQQFGLLGRSLYLKSCSHFSCPQHVSLSVPLHQLLEGCYSALGEGLKCPRGIFLVFMPWTCLTSWEHPIGIRAGVLSAFLPTPSLWCALAVCWWRSTRKRWLVVQTYSVAEAPWDFNPCDHHPHVVIKPS